MSNQRPGGPRSPPGGAVNDRSSPITTMEDPTDETYNLETDIFGDVLTHEKTPSTFRGISCQLGGLPTNANDPQYETFVKALLKQQMDVVAMQEISINFSYTGLYDQWKQ